MNLATLSQFVDEMQSSSSTNLKKTVLARYANDEFIKKVLLYTYSIYKKFNITSTNLIKRSDLSKPGYSDLFLLLDDLDARKITGHEALALTNGFINANIEHKDVILQVIDRNLKTRATGTIINSVIPKLIPTYDIQLAAKFHEFMAKVDAAIAKSIIDGKSPKYKLDLVNDTWYSSFKLDGLRCSGIVDEHGKVKFLSRGANEFTGLDRVRQSIESLGLRSVVFDGELCLDTEDGRDDFQGIQKLMGKDDYTIENPKYYIFDLIDLDEFTENAPEDKRRLLFGERLEILHRILSEPVPYLAILPQIRMESLDQIEIMKIEAIESGREGLILKKNTIYASGRSNDILKVKVMEDAEYRVTGHESDIHRIIIDKKEVAEEMLAAVYINHKGFKVKVGSGFSHQQRREFHANPSLIVGKIITVQYQSESQDQHGNFSLRFPVFKVLHGDERTM